MKERREFELFFRENYRRFYYFAYQLVGDGEICRDIVGDAFENAWLQYQQPGDHNLMSYMYSLVHHKCVDYIRHEQVKAKYADFYLGMYTENSDDEVDNEVDDDIEMIYQMLPKFTPKTQLILEMCYFKKKTYNEVAQELGISVSAVRKHIVNALKTFREEIAKRNK